MMTNPRKVGYLPETHQFMIDYITKATDLQRSNWFYDQLCHWLDRDPEATRPYELLVASIENARHVKGTWTLADDEDDATA